MYLRITFSIVIILLVGSCRSKKIEEKPSRLKLDIRLTEAEIDSLKSFIVQEYWKYDSVYFSPSHNCYFQQFVENELPSFGHYYDTVFRGVSVKHYFFPYTNFRFNLIRGSDGRFYYVGLSDWQYIFQGILNEKYVEMTRSEYRFKGDGSLRKLKLNASTEDAFNRIFQEDTLFHFSGYSDSFDAMRRAEGFVYSNYKYMQEGSGFPFVHTLGRSVSPPSVIQLMKKIKGAPLTQAELDMSESLERLIFFFMHERANLYHIEQVGILTFHFKKRMGLGRIVLSESLIPSLERPDISLMPGIDQLIDWSLYEECRDLPNIVVSESTDKD